MSFEPTIRKIKLTNILSFGSGGTELELRPLNVLIGPNGVGKSNFVDVLRLIKAAPTDIARPGGREGWVGDWIWKGISSIGRASVEVVVSDPRPYPQQQTASVPNEIPLVYHFAFGESPQGFHLIEEGIEDLFARNGEAVPRVHFPVPGEKRVGLGSHGMGMTYGSGATYGQYNYQKSVLAQAKHPSAPTEALFLAPLFLNFLFHSDLDTGPTSAIRAYQRTDAPTWFLEENCNNLWVFLTQLFTKFKAFEAQFNLMLKEFYEEAEKLTYHIAAGRVQVFIQERNLTQSISASRFSDGTLRWICLLAILLNPEPPPLICIEEPELGLHPDIIGALANLIKQASERTQVIVTTHSRSLVDEFTDTPEDVIVCEKEGGETKMGRLDRAELEGWLKHYTLGHTWATGAIGGNRW